MSHLDEGTLHALLDGELDLTEVSEIQMHLGSCVACGSRLQEVKQVLAEADRLVGDIAVPEAAAQPAPQRPVSRPSPSPLSRPRDPGIWDEAPVLLVPDPVDTGARRKRWIRGIGIAAGIAILGGGGKLATDLLKPGHPVLPDRDLTSAAPAVPPAVASREETQPPQPSAPAKAKARTPAARTPAPAVVVKPPSQTAESARGDTAGFADSASVDSAQLAQQGANDSGSGAGAVIAGAAVASKANSTTDSPSSAQSSESKAAREQDIATRAAAAAALAELDRQRTRERANAATAALPPSRPEPTPAESQPAPRPPTLEERSQIYLRIGLDEAVKQLGGPVHVIEGMTPQFIGLVRGQQVPGASPNRPVVRVVYLDPRGRMILLDQQRVDASHAPGATSGNLRWVIGDVMLYLRGEPTQDVLRTLQARVR